MGGLPAGRMKQKREVSRDSKIFKDGERIDIPERYHRETWELIRKLVSDLSNAAIAKAQ